MSPEIIGKVLDGGAWGVICPMVNTRAEAEALAAACLYPPEGKRSNGPIRAAMYGEASFYQDTANEHVLVIPMIETRAAVDNVEAILDVPGVSGIYVGPSDLAFSLGRKPSLDREDPDILQIYGKLIEAAAKRRQFVGVHTGKPEYAARMLDMGFRLVTIANDSSLLAKAARDAVRLTREQADHLAAARVPKPAATEARGSEGTKVLPLK